MSGRELGDGGVFADQSPENGAPHRIGERGEDGVEGGMVNH